MPRKLIAALVVALALGVVGVPLAGANANHPKPNAHASDTVTLKVFLQTELRPGFDAVFADVERAVPGVHVDVTYVPFAQYTNVLLTQLGSGGGPDIFISGAGNSDIKSVYPLARTNRLLDLSKGPWVSGLDPQLKRFLTYKNKVYATDLGDNISGLLYNKDLFGSLHVKPPQTFKDLIRVCGAFKKAGKVAISAGFASPNAGINYMSQAMGNYVYGPSPKWTGLRNRGRVTFVQSPLWKRALQRLVQLNTAGCFQPAPAATTAAAQFARFAAGDTGMTFAATNGVSQVLAINPKLRMGFTVLPADKAADTRILVASYALLSGNSHSAHPGQIRQVLNFLSTKRQLGVFAKASGSINPTSLTKYTLPQIAAGLAPMLKKGQYVISPTYGWPQPTIYVPQLAIPLTGLFTGQESVNSILARVDHAW